MLSLSQRCVRRPTKRSDGARRTNASGHPSREADALQRVEEREVCGP